MLSIFEGKEQTMTTNYYQRPSHLRVAVINPIMRYLVMRCGFETEGEQDVMRVLRVRGRKSGREYDVPVRVSMSNGKRYILSMLGDTQWARNLRAVEMAQLIAGEQIEDIRAYDVHDDEQADF